MLVAQHSSRLDTCRDHRTCYVIATAGGFRSVHDRDAGGGQRGERGIDGVHLIQQFRALGVQRPQRAVKIDRHHSAAAASFAAYAACFSLRAAFRVCLDLCSVFGFAFSRFFDSRVAGVVVEAISYSLSPSELLTPIDQERDRREPVALKPTALPWLAFAELITRWSCA